jgi:hypothetical protein
MFILKPIGLNSLNSISGETQNLRSLSCAFFSYQGDVILSRVFLASLVSLDFVKWGLHNTNRLHLRWLVVL